MTRSKFKAEGSQPASLLRIFLIVYLTGVVLCLLDRIDGQAFSIDIDDQMRAIQIRHLLSSSGRWWDLALPVITTPATYLSPWSRLIDLPYVIITGLLTPFTGADAALGIAFAVWAPLLLVVYSLLAASVYRRMALGTTLLDHLLIVAATALMVFAVWEYVPGRIDHHNVQFLTLLMIMAGLARWDRRGGVLIGLGTTLSVAIGLEGLPFVVVAFAGLFVATMARGRRAHDVLLYACAAILVTTLPLAFALIGPAGMASVQCDAFSAPYILLLLGCGLALGCVSLSARRFPVWVTLFLAAVPTAVTVGLFLLLFPQCLAGPYWMIDPVSTHYWFSRIAQEQDLLYFVRQGQFGGVVFRAVLALLVLASVPCAARAARAGRPEAAIMVAIAAVSILLAVMLDRYTRFASALVPLLLPAVCRSWSAETGATGAAGRAERRVLAAVAIGMARLLAALRPLFPPAPLRFDIIDMMALDSCRGGDFSAVSSVPAGRIIAPLGLALPLAAALPDGFSVAALPFHRAAPGIRRVFEAFTSTNAETRRNALAPFDYVAVCRYPFAPGDGEAPLYKALGAGKDWPGLIRVPVALETPFQLFRIDHAALY